MSTYDLTDLPPDETLSRHRLIDLRARCQRMQSPLRRYLSGTPLSSVRLAHWHRAQALWAPPYLTGPSGLCELYREKKDRGRRLGAAVATLVQAQDAGDEDALLEAFREVHQLQTPRRVSLTVQVILQEVADELDLVQCAHCDEWVARDEIVGEADDFEGPICDRCADEFYLTDDGAFVHMDADVEAVYTTLMEYERDEPARYYYEVPFAYDRLSDDLSWRQSTNLIRDSLATELGFTYHSGEWCERPESPVYPYRSHPRRRTDFFQEPKQSSSTHPAIGFEFEMLLSDPEDTLVYLEEHGLEVLAERDSSLSDEVEGVELITPPRLPEQWIADASMVMRGFNRGGHEVDASCGTHATIRREHLSPLQEWRLLKFLSAWDNRVLVRAVAGRVSIYTPDLDIGAMSPEAKVEVGGGIAVRDYGRKTYKRLRGAGRYCPINFKGPLAEWRLFAGVQDATDIQVFTEFLWSLVLWTRPQEATGCSTDHRCYLDWLGRKDADFPQVWAHVNKDRFTLADDIQVHRTW